MRVFNLAIVILYLSNHLAYCSVDDDFVDPLDMLNYDRATKSMKRPKKISDSEPMQINDRCTAFLSRFINVLLKTTGLDVSYTFQIYIDTSWTILPFTFYSLFRISMKYPMAIAKN